MSTSDVLKSMPIVLVSMLIVLVSVFWLFVLSINCIGMTVLIPYVMVFVVTVLLIFLTSKVFGYCHSVVTTSLIIVNNCYNHRYDHFYMSIYSLV